MLLSQREAGGTRGQPSLSTRRTPAVEESKMIYEGLSDTRLFAENLIPDLQTADAIHPMSPTRQLVKESSICFSCRQPQLSRSLAPIHLDAKVHFCHLATIGLSLLTFIQRKGSCVLHSIQGLNAVKCCVSGLCHSCSDLSSTREEMVSKIF